VGLNPTPYRYYHRGTGKIFLPSPAEGTPVSAGLLLLNNLMLSSMLAGAERNHKSLSVFDFLLFGMTLPDDE